MDKIIEYFKKVCGMVVGFVVNVLITINILIIKKNLSTSHTFIL